MSVRKYISEFGLNMMGTWKVLMQQDDLTEPGRLDHLPDGVSFHIYMIVRRPRMGFRPDTLELRAGILSGHLTLQKGLEFESHAFEIPHKFDVSKVTLDCPYPHTSIRIKDLDGQEVFFAKVPLLISHAGHKFDELMDLEVLYVGQSFGDDGSRVAPDRLKSHSTLQGIYAEALSRSPDKEIWIVLWSFEPLLLSSFGGFQHVFGTTESEDDHHIDEVLKTGISKQQQINFTEAALIRYFRPEYNQKFKDSFPSPAHSTYSECYDIDLNLVAAELQTEQIRCRLWSQAAPAAWVHFARFELHDRSDRMGMFDFNRNGEQADNDQPTTVQ